MNFNKHLNLEGQHAFLGASKYHWVRYDEEKIVESYSKFLATLKGTELHEFAARCIKLGQKLPNWNDYPTYRRNLTRTRPARSRTARPQCTSLRQRRLH